MKTHRPSNNQDAAGQTACDLFWGDSQLTVLFCRQPLSVPHLLLNLPLKALAPDCLGELAFGQEFAPTSAPVASL